MPGLLVTLVDDLRPRPRARGSRRGRVATALRGAHRDDGVHGGRGGDHADRGTGAPGALEGDVARVPCGRALVLQRLVALVQHDHRREVGHRRPHRVAPADHHAGAGAGARPVLGAECVAVLGTELHDVASLGFAARGERGAARRRRVDHQRRALRRQRHVRDQVVAGSDHVEPRPGERRARVHRGLTLDLIVDRHQVGRRRRTQERGQRTGPAPRRPPAEVDDVGRWSRRRDREHLAQLGRLGLLDVIVEHPPAHPSSVQRDAHHRSHGDRARAT